MKTHPPVNAGKTSAGKPVKQFRCGKCKKTFPKGQGHNARTCGKTSHMTPKKEPVSRFKNPTPSTGAERTPSISEVDTLLQQKLKKGGKVSYKPQRTVDKLGGEKKREGGIPLGDFIDVWIDDGVVQVQTVEKDYYINYVTLPEEWAGRYEYIEDEGDRYWFDQLSRVHAENKPAIMYDDGGEEWYTHGKLHNPDGPAVEWVGGYKEWWVDGKLHRLDGPAVEWVNGDKEWWVNDVETEHPDLCERAVLPDLTDEEFYELCTHKDYVVRQLVAHNPRCPAEWRTLVEVMDG